MPVRLNHSDQACQRELRRLSCDPSEWLAESKESEVAVSEVISRVRPGQAGPSQPRARCRWGRDGRCLAHREASHLISLHQPQVGHRAEARPASNAHTSWERETWTSFGSEPGVHGFARLSRSISGRRLDMAPYDTAYDRDESHRRVDRGAPRRTSTHWSRRRRSAVTACPRRGSPSGTRWRSRVRSC